MTYCGKSCEYCQWKEELSCEGCKNGPGQALYGDCQLAICCRERRHETCETCLEREFCSDLEKRSATPQERLERRQRELQLQERTAAIAPRVAMLLGILFWLVIPRGVSVLLGQETLTARLPVLGMVASVLGSVCNLAYALVLLKLAFASGKYRSAAMCSLVSWGFNAIMLFMKASAVTTVLVVVVMAVTLVSDYFEFHGHGELLDPLHSAQADAFRMLWKWNIAATGAVMGGLILLVISPFFGIVTLLTGATGVVVVGVRKLICLNRAWKLFRDYE